MAAAGAPLGPGDLGMVYGCLTAALNADPATRQPAEAALQELEARGGFCSCLLVSPGSNLQEPMWHLATWGLVPMDTPLVEGGDVLGFWQGVQQRGVPGMWRDHWNAEGAVLFSPNPPRPLRRSKPSVPAQLYPFGRRKNDRGGAGERRRR